MCAARRFLGGGRVTAYVSLVQHPVRACSYGSIVPDRQSRGKGRSQRRNDSPRASTHLCDDAVVIRRCFYVGAVLSLVGVAVAVAYTAAALWALVATGPLLAGHGGKQNRPRCRRHRDSLPSSAALHREHRGSRLAEAGSSDSGCRRARTRGAARGRPAGSLTASVCQHDNPVRDVVRREHCPLRRHDEMESHRCSPQS